MTDIVSCVLTNLSTILRQEIEFLGGLRVEVQSIKDEFQQMLDFLEGAELLVQDHPDIRSWIGQIRDVAYDVEDILDEFLMHCTYRRSSRWYAVFQKMYTKSVGVIKARHELATRIQEIKKRIRDISESHRRYKTQYQSLLPGQVSSSRASRGNSIVYDKRGDALLLEYADLVGIEVPKKELIDLLHNEDSRRNVIAVVGMGGLGKTTLVKKVYDDVNVKSLFGNHVWITVSESFKLEELFKDTIRQLFNEEGRQLPQEFDGMDINRLRLVVKNFLQTKKYIVVFDDVWQLTHWDAIHLAFPRNQFGSRILITTRNLELSQAVSASDVGGFVYPLSPLNNEKSMVLFCRKAFTDGASCPPHLKQICEKILGACEGLPLAIEVIGSILARRGQREKEWELFYKRLGMEMERNSQLDAMTKVLSLSYHELPLHLKNCFLYLSIFPEDTKIDIRHLAELWIAEGFVQSIDGLTLEEVAESYLCELVDRCLVQVVMTNHDGSIKGIRVHDIIRHVVLVKASEHNMTTIFNGHRRMSFPNNVRRLSIQGLISGNSEEAQDHCKSIRTLYLCKEVGGHISEPFLSNLLSRCRKVLKVLDLTGAQLTKIPEETFKLFHLKFLNLQNTNVNFVPKSIGMLQSLQSLILIRTNVTELPVELQKLQHLRHLIIGRIHQKRFLLRIDDIKGVTMSFRIGNLKSLQQLIYIEANQVGNIRTATELGKLIHLRKLGVTKLKREDGKELCSSLGHLRELRDLIVNSVDEGEVIDFQYFKFSNLPHLQTLSLGGCLEKCPESISSLNGLTRIELLYSRLNDDPLNYLQDLPNLIILNLTAAYEGESLCFKAGRFPKLKHLYLHLLQELRWMTVEEHGLPSLRFLSIRVCQSVEQIISGIEYLVHLQELEFSNMSNEFLNKLDNLDNRSAAFERLLQIPRFVIATWNDDSWSEVRRLNKRTGKFLRL